MTTFEFRPPAPNEHRLMATLTSRDFVGRTEVMIQLESSLVRVIDDDGSLELHVFREAASVRHPIPTELYGLDVDGMQISVMLHVVDGFCREIEIYKVDGSPIQRMPDTWESFVPGPEWHSGSSA
jgi:hypothetical protein